MKKVWSRAAAAATTLGVAASGVVLVSAPAEAKLRESDYGLQTSAYGTRIYSNGLGIESGRTALTYINCTRMLGINRSESAVNVQAPADDPLIYVGGVVNKNRTYRAPEQGVVAAASSTSSIAEIALGSSETALFRIRGLEATSTAWADKKGKLHADNDVTATRIQLSGLDQIPGGVTAPIQQLLDAITGGLQQVLELLGQPEHNGGIEIPGLGVISVGYDRTNIKKKTAAAEAAVLKIKLYGPNLKKGGGDDSMVHVGRTWARVNKGIPAGLLRGKAWGANIDLLGGILGVGELGLTPLPCRGTDGKIRSSSSAGLNLVDQLTVGAAQSRVMGKQKKNGRAVAWTEGSLARIKLGPLEIKGITARANVKQKKSGKIKTNIKGSSLGEVYLDGELQGGFDHKQARQIPPMDIPGVAKIEFFKKSDWGGRGVRVSAVVITLLENTPVGSVIRLGNAQAKIQKY